MAKLQKYATAIGAFGIALIIAAFMLSIVTTMRRDYLLLIGGLGVILIGFYIITRPRDATRQTSNLNIAAQGGNVILFALAFIGILGAINFIVERQFSQRLDLTANQEHTLSPQTIQILNALQEPIQVIGFFTPQSEGQRKQAAQLFNDYQNVTDKFNAQFVDPDLNPVLAKKYDVALDGTIIFEKGARTEKVLNADENTFTNAILQVTQAQQPAIYFTTGHGELSPNDSQQSGLTTIATYLKQINYRVEPLSLAISTTLPADTSALVIAGPTEKFSPESVNLLKTYLDQGGRVLLMTELNTELGLDELLKAWGVALENNIVLEPQINYYGKTAIPIFQEFSDSPVTENMRGQVVYFPGARSIKELEEGDTDVTALLTTTADACAKNDFKKIQEQTTLLCEEGDASGPFTVGYAIEGAGGGGANPDKRSRLIVLGNASFATNQSLQNPESTGNGLLIQNMLNWLAGQEQLIAIPPREPNDRRLTAFTGADVNLVFWTTVALIPLAALTIGGLLWWRRR